MTTDLILTDWIPCTPPPVRVGVYEVDDEDGFKGPWFAYWDGEKFGYRDFSVQGAFDNRDKYTACAPRAKWRGVRRWVLTKRGTVSSQPYYLTNVPNRGRRAGVPNWHFDLARAMGFDSEEDAQTFGLMNSLGAGWKAVLP